MIVRWRVARPPVCATVLTVVTGVVSVLGLVSPAVLGGLRRSPAAWHGEPWRWVTSLLVQDSGVLGTMSNVVFLVALGVAAEQVTGRVALVVRYLVAGLAGQVAGMWWQPFGAGNSVAVCGPAGIVAWSMADGRLPRWAGPALGLWLGGLLATWWPPLIVVGFASVLLDGVVRQRWPEILVPVAVLGCAVVAVVLMAVGNIHGAALAVGTVVGGSPAGWTSLRGIVRSAR